jgi:Family of unknown function (DUF5309)
MPVGRVTTYDLTVGVIVDMEDMIHLISPTDAPIQQGTSAGGLSLITNGTCFEKKVEWLDEELLLPRSTMGAAAVTADAFITVATGHQLRFSTGDVLLLASGERVRVTGYGVTADTLLVTRGFTATTAGQVAINSVVVNYGQALAEGSDPENARALDRVGRLNYTEIFGPTAVLVSGTENVIRKYGLTGTTEFDKQSANRIKEQFIAVDQAILYGKALEDTTNKWRTMGGMIDFITTNVNTTTTTLTEATLLDSIQLCYDAGGAGDGLIAQVGSKQKRVISAFATALTINVDRGQNVRGQTVDVFESDFGMTTIVLNRNVRNADLFLYSRDQAQLCVLRPMQFEMLAKTGDSMKGQVLRECTLKFYTQTHAARFSALT